MSGVKVAVCDPIDSLDVAWSGENSGQHETSQVLQSLIVNCAREEHAPPPPSHPPFHASIWSAVVKRSAIPPSRSPLDRRSHAYAGAARRDAIFGTSGKPRNEVADGTRRASLRGCGRARIVRGEAPRATERRTVGRRGLEFAGSNLAPARNARGAGQSGRGAQARRGGARPRRRVVAAGLRVGL